MLTVHELLTELLVHVGVTQAETPVAFEQLLLQLDDPAEFVVPFGQTVHPLAPAALYDPAAQFVQLDDPATANLPAAH